ncbi:MAG TPA: carbonic anhydrase family protein [Candidatus Kryptonia bacterium]|nr:carbonic anhydrase family protein [Candidatus Kryptonia bacterium]
MKCFAPAVALCVFALTTCLAAQETPSAAKPDVQTRESQAAMTPSTALERLKQGNARFVSNTTKPRNWSAKVAATASGQFPYAAILACMDSRAPSEIVFDQGLGDVFGIRVAGNVVNDDELGSLEYAIKVGTKLIVVLGHTGCGAVKGAIDDAKLGNLTGLLAKIRPAVAAASCNSSQDDACVGKVAEMNVRQSMKEIRERSPYLKKYLDEGTVGLVGAIYDVKTGKVTFLEN